MEKATVESGGRSGEEISRQRVILQFLHGMLPFVARLWDGLAKQRMDEVASAPAVADAEENEAASAAEPDELAPSNSAAAEAVEADAKSGTNEDGAKYNPVVAPLVPQSSRFFANMASDNPAMTHPPMPQVTLDGLPVSLELAQRVGGFTTDFWLPHFAAVRGSDWQSRADDAR